MKLVKTIVWLFLSSHRAHAFGGADEMYRFLFGKVRTEAKLPRRAPETWRLHEQTLESSIFCPHASVG